MIGAGLKISSASELHRMEYVMSTIMSYININCPNLMDDDVFELRLIYSELLCNAVIHGNKNDMSKNVHISVDATPYAIWSEITDEGDGFNYAKVIKDERAAQNLLAESGRGIVIVKSLTDLLRFNKYGNSVEFYKEVSVNKDKLSSDMFSFSGQSIYSYNAGVGNVQLSALELT